MRENTEDFNYATADLLRILFSLRFRCAGQMRRAAAAEFSHNISLFVGDTVNPLSLDLTSTIRWKAKARLMVRSTRKEEMVLHNEGVNDELYAFRRDNEWGRDD